MSRWGIGLSDAPERSNWRDDFPRRSAARKLDQSCWLRWIRSVVLETCSFLRHDFGMCSTNVSAVPVGEPKEPAAGGVGPADEQPVAGTDSALDQFHHRVGSAVSNHCDRRDLGELTATIEGTSPIGWFRRRHRCVPEGPRTRLRSGCRCRVPWQDSGGQPR